MKYEFLVTIKQVDGFLLNLFVPSTEPKLNKDIIMGLIKDAENGGSIAMIYRMGDE